MISIRQGVAGLLAAVFLGLPGRAEAKIYLTVPEALRLVFPEDTEVKTRTGFLHQDEVRRAEVIAGGGIKVESALVRFYEAHKENQLEGTAYLDSHLVRTLKETVMVVVDAQGVVQSVHILSFGEPIEYFPSQPWMNQFKKKPLSDELSLKREIRGITGATLTARAIMQAVRRVLALHTVLGERNST